MKTRIRLTESDLHRIVKESVNRILNEIGDSPIGQYQLGRLSKRNMGIYGDDRGVHDYSNGKVEANDSKNGKDRLKTAYVDGVKDQGRYMDAIDNCNDNDKYFAGINIKNTAKYHKDHSDRNLKKKYRLGID